MQHATTQAPILLADSNTEILQTPIAAPASPLMPSTFRHPMTTRQKDNTRSKKQFPDHVTFLATKRTLPPSPPLNEPTSFTMENKFAEWREAMANELNTLAHNNTRILVLSSPKQHIIGCKWIYKVKKKASGSIERHKDRIVTKGYSQEEDIDYHETFSLVVKPTTICIVLALAMSHH